MKYILRFPSLICPLGSCSFFPLVNVIYCVRHASEFLPDGVNVFGQLQLVDIIVDGVGETEVMSSFNFIVGFRHE